jgi:hypothetical protein
MAYYTDDMTWEEVQTEMARIIVRWIMTYDPEDTPPMLEKAKIKQKSRSINKKQKLTTQREDNDPKENDRSVVRKKRNTKT